MTSDDATRRVKLTMGRDGRRCETCAHWTTEETQELRLGTCAVSGMSGVWWSWLCLYWQARAKPGESEKTNDTTSD